MLGKCSQEDYEYLSQFSWHLDHKGYVVSTRRPHRGARMHRLVAERMGLNIAGLQVDHINGVKADNRRENLRVATNGQNRANSKLNSNNTSGLKGVSRKNGRWVAVINVGGKKHHLGYFDKKEQAHEAYKKAAIEAFGEFARV